MNIKEEVLKQKESLINNLIDWVKIKSVYDETTVAKLAPFGNGPKNSLDYIYNLALKEGFKVTNYDGYCVEIEYGCGDEIIGIFGHADVVPEGNNWDSDPYNPIIKDNLIYGRGTSDDKGPTLCSFYALKILKDNGIVPNKTIRLVVGGNEECGSACLKYYFETLKRPNPTYGFTPDAEFPLIYGEKGILSYRYFGDFEDNVIKSIDGGLVGNAVPRECIISVKEKIEDLDKFDKLCIEYGLKYEIIDELTFKFIGKAAHASEPWLGINAVTLGLRVIGKTTNSELAGHFSERLRDYYGKGVMLNHKGKMMGDLTFNIGIGKYDGKHYEFLINIRYPNDMNEAQIVKTLGFSKMHEGELVSNSNPLYVNPKSKFIKTLLKAYKDVTGDKKAKPMTIGGGTYARETINTVAFGMDFRRNNGTGRIHDANEAINIDDLVDGTEIYVKAILGLLDL